jgi:hypothetical protein
MKTKFNPTKKLLALAAVAVLVGTAAGSFATLAPVKKMEAPKHEWTKSTTGTWAGQEKMWFKLNKEFATIWSSADGQKWDQVKEGTWQDKSGHWLKIDNKMLVGSADGKTWTEVPEWKWEGSDGTMNKFDTDWTLWVMTHNH